MHLNSKGRWWMVMLLVVVLCIGISSSMLAGISLPYFDSRIVRVPMTAGRSALLEIVTLNYSAARDPNYVNPYAATWDSWGRWTSSSRIVRNSLRVTIVSVDARTHTSPTILRFTLSQNVLAGVSLLCLLMWLVTMLIRQGRRRTERTRSHP